MYIPKREDYLISTRIDLGDFVKRSKGEAFLVLREPPMKSFIRLQKAANESTEALLEVFADVFPEILTDHSFYQDEKTPMEASELCALIFESLDMTLATIEQYKKEVLFTLGKRRSENSGI